MKLRADEVRRGDQMDGGTVVWTLPLPDGSAVVVAVHPRGQAAVPGLSRTRRYRPDEVVEIIDRGW
jgi:hypothetical protein